MNSNKQNANKAKAEEISRKEALKKMGRYAPLIFNFGNLTSSQAFHPFHPCQA